MKIFLYIKLDLIETSKIVIVFVQLDLTETIIFVQLDLTDTIVFVQLDLIETMLTVFSNKLFILQTWQANQGWHMYEDRDRVFPVSIYVPRMCQWQSFANLINSWQFNL